MKLSQAAGILLANPPLMAFTIRRTMFMNLFVTIMLAWSCLVSGTCERTIEVPIGNVIASTVLKSHQLASPINNVVKVSGTAKARTSALSTAYFYLKDASGNNLGFLNIVPGNYQSKDGSKDFDIPLDKVDAVHMYSWWNSAELSNLVITTNTCTKAPTETQVPTTLPTKTQVPTTLPSVVPTTCERTTKVPIGKVIAGTVLKSHQLASPMNNVVKVSGTAKARTSALSTAYFYLKDASGNNLGFLNIVPGNYQSKDESKDFDIPLDKVDAVHMYSWWNSAELSNLVITTNTCTKAPTETQVPTTLPTKTQVPTTLPSVVPTTCERTTKVPIGKVIAGTVLKSHQLASPMNNVVKVSGTAKARTSALSTAYFYLKDASGNNLGFLNIVPGNYQSKDGSKDFDIPLDNVEQVHMYSWWNSAELSNLVITINTCTQAPTESQVPTTSPSMIISSRPSSAPSVGNICDGKGKKVCRNLDSCVFGQKKIAGKCEPKKSKYNKDCGQFDAKDTCLNESGGNCMWDGKCTHRCDGLAEKDCKKVKNPEDNNLKMCKAKMLSNPCKGCQSKTTCG